MKKLMIVLVALTSVSAFARDSSWKLCKGDAVLFDEPAKLVVNVFEHRNSTGDGRVTDLTLIFGSHILRGQFDSTEDDSGKVLLIDSELTYTGHVKVDYENNTIALNGILDLLEKTNVKAVLKCETLGD